jgi:hypothetical protein
LGSAERGDAGAQRRRSSAKNWNDAASLREADRTDVHAISLA